MLLEILAIASVIEAAIIINLYRSKPNTTAAVAQKFDRAGRILAAQTAKEEALCKEVLDLIFQREFLFLDSTFLTIDSKKMALKLVKEGLLYIENPGSFAKFKMTEAGKEYYELMY